MFPGRDEIFHRPSRLHFGKSWYNRPRLDSGEAAVMNVLATQAQAACGPDGAEKSFQPAPSLPGFGADSQRCHMPLK